MKRFKQWMSAVVAVFALCFMFTNVITANAEEMTRGKIYVAPYTTVKGKIKNTTKMRLVTQDSDYFYVYYGAGDSIQKLKSNKKGLTAKVTYTYSTEQTATEAYGYSRIHVDATKAGKYKLSFNVVGLDGKVKAKKSITIQVVNTDTVIKKATFGKQTVRSNVTTVKNGTVKTVTKYNEKVKSSSGNFKVTPNSQYKITGLVVVSLDKNGKEVYKKIGNGKNISLSKTYDYISKSTNGYSRSTKKLTYIYVSYKDTFFGNTCKYSVVKKRGVTEVKCVRKNALTGETSIYYDPSATVTLWQY